MPADAPSTPRVKICGLTHNDDARLAERLGADLLGFVLSRGFGRSVPEDAATSVAFGTGVERVAVLVDEPVDRAARLARSIDAAVIQLHGSESPETVERLRSAGEWRVWKAVRARSLEDVARAVLDYGSLADGLLLEGWKAGVTGGGGARLELGPDEVRREMAGGPALILAGGLTPDNVADAVAQFGPDIVDVSSGVETTPGRKNPELVRRFVAVVKANETRSWKHI
ncbi:MAG: phosphoribosylanthranilate isomerase [Gemmatimonadota bacterium]